MTDGLKAELEKEIANKPVFWSDDRHVLWTFDFEYKGKWVENVEYQGGNIGYADVNWLLSCVYDGQKIVFATPEEVLERQTKLNKELAEKNRNR